MKFTDFQDFLNQSKIIATNTAEKQNYRLTTGNNNVINVGVELGDVGYKISQAEKPSVYPAQVLVDYQGNLYHHVAASQEDGSAVESVLGTIDPESFSCVTVTLESLQPLLDAVAAQHEEKVKAEAAAKAKAEEAEAAAKAKAEDLAREQAAAAQAKEEAIEAAKRAAKAAHLGLVDAQTQLYAAGTKVMQDNDALLDLVDKKIKMSAELEEKLNALMQRASESEAAETALSEAALLSVAAGTAVENLSESADEAERAEKTSAKEQASANFETLRLKASEAKEAWSALNEAVTALRLKLEQTKENEKALTDALEISREEAKTCERLVEAARAAKNEADEHVAQLTPATVDVDEDEDEDEVKKNPSTEPDAATPDQAAAKMQALKAAQDAAAALAEQAAAQEKEREALEAEALAKLQALNAANQAAEQAQSKVVPATAENSDDAEKGKAADLQQAAEKAAADAAAAKQAYEQVQAQIEAKRLLVTEAKKKAAEAQAQADALALASKPEGKDKQEEKSSSTSTLVSSVVSHAKPYVSAETKSLTTGAALMATPYAAVWAVSNLGLFEAAVSPLVFSALVVPVVAGLAMQQIYIMHEMKRFAAENPGNSVDDMAAHEALTKRNANFVAGNFIVAYAATQIVTHFALSALANNLNMGAMISGSPLEAQLVMMALAGVAFGATMMFMTAMKTMYATPKGDKVDWKAAAPAMLKSFAIGLVTGVGIHAAGMIPGLNAAYGHAMPGWTASTLAVAGQLLAVAVPFAGTMLVDAPSYKPTEPKKESEVKAAYGDRIISDENPANDIKVEDVTLPAAPVTDPVKPEATIKVEDVTPPAAPVTDPVKSDDTIKVEAETPPAATKPLVTGWMKLMGRTGKTEQIDAVDEHKAANDSAKQSKKQTYSFM